MYHFGSKRNDIIIFQFANKKKMNKTFIRLSEFSENQHFSGKVVPAQEIKKWWTDKYKIDYINYWDGHNIPDIMVEEFKKRCKNFTPEEKWLFNKIDMYAPNHKYCVIATLPDSEVLLHEMAHAMFYGDAKYKKSALKILRTVNTKKIQKTLFKEYGYHKDVLLDETIAYLLDGSEHIIEDSGLNKSAKVKNLQKQLLLNYAKHMCNGMGRLIKVG